MFRIFLSVLRDGFRLDYHVQNVSVTFFGRPTKTKTPYEDEDPFIFLQETK